MKSYVSREDRASCELFYDPQQWRELRDDLQATADRAAIEEVTGVREPQLLEALAALRVDIETLAMLTMVPMVKVAWASGRVEVGERDVLLMALHGADAEPNAVVRGLIELYMKREPTDALYGAWSRCVREVNECLSPEMRRAFAHHIMKLCQNVANSAGGFLGIGKICAGEQDAIDAIRTTLESAYE